MKVYVILVDYKNSGVRQISSRCYNSLECAKQYIETRPDKPTIQLEGGWTYETADGKKRYCITDIEIV